MQPYLLPPFPPENEIGENHLDVSYQPVDNISALILISIPMYIILIFFSHSSKAFSVIADFKPYDYDVPRYCFSLLNYA